MVILDGNKTEKVTFNIPVELKERVSRLKNEMQVSFSTIYNEAIAQYVRQKEIERWQKGAQKALGDGKYLKEATEIGSDDGEIHDY